VGSSKRDGRVLFSSKNLPGGSGVQGVSLNHLDPLQTNQRTGIMDVSPEPSEPF